MYLSRCGRSSAVLGGGKSVNTARPPVPRNVLGIEDRGRGCAEDPKAMELFLVSCVADEGADANADSLASFIFRLRRRSAEWPSSPCHAGAQDPSMPWICRKPKHHPHCPTRQERRSWAPARRQFGQSVRSWCARIDHAQLPMPCEQQAHTLHAPKHPGFPVH